MEKIIKYQKKYFILGLFKMSEEDLELFLKKNKESITLSNMLKVFKKVYNKVLNIDSKIFYDFLGDVLLEKSSYREGKNHLRMLKIYAKFARNISSVKQLKDELYFIEKYCIFEGEEVLVSFDGIIHHRSVSYYSRNFITNYRIIIVGTLSESHATPLLFGIVYQIIEASIRKAWLRSKLTGTKNAFKSKNIIPFGYVFPIMNSKAINLIKKKERIKRLSFTSCIHDGKKDRFFKLKIVVTRPHTDEEQKEIYQKIVEILRNTQTDLNNSA